MLTHIHGEVIPFAAPTNESLKPKYSFEIVQWHSDGLVSIDAVVPLEVAIAMMEMLYKPKS